MPSPPPLLFPTLWGYDLSRQLFKDCIAGLTVGALCVPQSMSYAGLAGLPVQNGLYSDLQIAYQSVGTSRHLVVGPVAIMSLLAYECLSKTDLEPLSADWVIACSLLSLCVGISQFVMAALGLGNAISTALSENTLKAFTSCASLTIAGTQAPAFFACSPLSNCWAGSERASSTWLVSFCSLALLEAFRLVPHTIGQKMGALVVLTLGIAAAYVFQLEESNVALVGYIPPGLPSSISPLYADLLHAVSPAVFQRIALFTLPMSLIGFAESFAIAKTGREDVLHANRELAALALANVWTSLLGGYPVSGSFSRSAVNLEAGATSCVSALVAFALVILVLAVFTPWLALLPKACVACIVLSAVVRLIDLDYVQNHLWRQARWKELAIYAIIFFLGLLAGVEFGLAAGLCFDLLQRFLLHRAPLASTISLTREGKTSDGEEEGIVLVQHM